MRTVPWIRSSGLPVLGLLLVLHPLVVNVQHPLYQGTHTISQFAIDVGWVYLLVGATTAVLVYNRDESLTPERMLPAMGLLIPLLVVVFYTNFLGPTASTSLDDALETALLLVPVVLAFPMGTAVRGHRWKVLVVSGFSWVVSWAFLPVAEIGGLLTFLRELYLSGIVWMLGGLLFMWLLLLPYYLAVLPFILPPFVAGVVFDQPSGKSPTKATKGQ